METFNISEACKAQAKLCKEKNYPDFAPTSGVCYSCGRNIYSKLDHGKHHSGVTVEKASTQLITGCPHCHRSYCD